jgi:hypothetical protein
MSDDEVAGDHGDVPASAGEQNAAAREHIVTDYTAVPGMIAELQRVYVLSAPRMNKQVLAVMALLRVVSVAAFPDPRAARQVLDLLSPRGVKHYRDLMRGMVVAAIAWLRAAEMTNADIERWLAGQIKRLDPPFILGFTATQAMRWFYHCTEKLPDTDRYRAPAVMSDTLKSFGPDPSQPPSKYQATTKAAELLEAVCQINPVPLGKAAASAE